MPGIAPPDGFDLPSGPHPEGRVAWLRFAVLCDAARLEVGGKRTLIGAYDGAVQFHSCPAIFSGRLVGAFEFIQPGKHELEFRVTTPTAVGAGRMVAPEDAEAGGIGPFDIPVEFLLAEPGEIRLDWRLDGQAWGPPMVWRLQVAEDAKRLEPEAAQRLRVLWNATVATRVDD